MKSLFFVIWLLTLSLPSFAADHISLQTGKRYWIVDSLVAYKAGDSYAHFNLTYPLRDIYDKGSAGNSFILTSKDGYFYTLKFTGDVERQVKGEYVEDAFKKNVIVNFDPAKRAKQRAVATARKRTEMIRSKKWPANIEKLVLERKIQLGMTTEQAELAWGKPKTINRTVNARGVSEQWVYGSSYLYFDDGILRSWQDSR